MATKVYMEALSPTMEEGRVVSWLKSEGDAITSGDILAEIETDKAIMELQARGDGVLRKALAPAGATVEVGKVIAVIAAEDEDIADILGGDGAPGGTPQHTASADQPSVEQADLTISTAPAAVTGGTPGSRIKSSPLARKLATDRGVDLAALSGTGPGGRIIKRDVESASTGAVHGVPTAAAATEFEDVPLTQIRKTIAKRLAQSLSPIPHFFLTSDIDMERVWDARQALNEPKGAPRISFNDIVVKVVAEALHRHPECNAWWMDGHIRYFNVVHIGMAVAIDDGLITPVIRHAHAKTLREISGETRDLAERARERKLLPDEYTGSTFSVSNLGMFDIHEFTAVINPPEAGILAIGGIRPEPVAVNNEVAVRRRMRITMSCDHRVIDGATGARFLQTVKQMLENPLAIVW